MKLSYAVWGHPRRVGHGGEVWQNVVHWRREQQATSVFLPWEPHEQYEQYENGSFSDTEFYYFLLTNHDTMILNE